VDIWVTRVEFVLLSAAVLRLIWVSFRAGTGWQSLLWHCFLFWGCLVVKSHIGFDNFGQILHCFFIACIWGFFFVQYPVREPSPRQVEDTAGGR